MNSSIEVKETIYKGFRFRSRLEARWAVFLDSLGVEYEYEPEGFNLPGVGAYLPDFRVMCYADRGHDCEPYPLYIEVKGRMDEASAAKIKTFSYYDRIDAYCDSFPDNPAPSGRKSLLIVSNIPTAQSIEDISDSSVMGSYNSIGFDLCPFNYETVDSDYFAAYPCVDHGRFGLLGDDCHYLHWGDHLHTLYAYKAARQARFEHGEKPKLVPMNSKGEMIAGRALDLFAL